MRCPGAVPGPSGTAPRSPGSVPRGLRSRGPGGRFRTLRGRFRCPLDLSQFLGGRRCRGIQDGRQRPWTGSSPVSRGPAPRSPGPAPRSNSLVSGFWGVCSEVPGTGSGSPGFWILRHTPRSPWPALDRPGGPNRSRGDQSRGPLGRIFGFGAEVPGVGFGALDLEAGSGTLGAGSEVLWAGSEILGTPRSSGQVLDLRRDPWAGPGTNSAPEWSQSEADGGPDEADGAPDEADAGPDEADGAPDEADRGPDEADGAAE